MNEYMYDPSGYGDYLWNLMSYVGVFYGGGGLPYEHLCELLHKIPVNIDDVLPEDEARVEDGATLQAHYIDADPEKYFKYFGVKCSLFEFILALAMRINDLCGAGLIRVFSEILAFSGLSEYTDDFFRMMPENEVAKKVGKWPKLISKNGHRDLLFRAKKPLFWDKKWPNRPFWHQINAISAEFSVK